MASPTVFVWVPANTTYIAQVQSLGAAGSMVLNGSVIQPQSITINQTAVFPGFNRLVTLTSANNNAGVNFTINGYLNGIAVTETIAGPNANTVASAQLYDQVTSITTNGAINAVSAGIGNTGNTSWFTCDQYRDVFNLGIQVQVSAGTITYSFQVTEDNVQTIATPLTFTPIVAMTAATTNQLANYTNPIRYCRVNISAAAGTETLRATILQQGLR